MTGSNRRRAGTSVALLALILANVIIWATDSLVMQAVAGVVLLALLPGGLLTGLLLGQDESLDVVERVVLGVGLGYACLVLGALLLHYLPGPLTRTLLLAPYDVLAALLIILRVRQSASSIARPRIPRRVAAGLVLLVIVGAFFRFSNLGYSEFQGDEGRAMLRAAEVVQGQDQVLFLHKKGPVEILMPAAFYALAGRIDERTARFPFALANLAALVALFVLGRRAFDWRVGLLAMALVVIDGYWVAFARIVQYQSVVLLTTLLTLFCVYRAYQSRHLRRRYLMVAAVLAGVGLLAHYEGFFALPAATYLIWATLRRESARPRKVVRLLAPPTLLGGAIAGAFYVPFILHPHFATTATYLSEKRVGGTPLYNNIVDFFNRASFYNASYYVMFLGVLLAVGAFALLLRAAKTSRQRVGVGLLAIVWMTVLFFPQCWQIGSVNLSVVVFLATLAALLVVPASTELRLLQIWFGVAALFYFFLMLKVHTHYYVAFPAWSLIAGLVLSGAYDRLAHNASGLRWLALGATAALWLVCAGYIYIAFVQHTPEYRSVYPDAKPWFYWTPFGRHPPGGGYFGFPYCTAWKAVGGLYDAGVLKGTYDSNQKANVTNWYARGALRCASGQYFVVARDVGNPHALIPGVIDGRYMPAIEVVSDGEAKLWVFKRGYEGEIAQYDLAALAADFDRRLSGPTSWFGPPLDEVFNPPYLIDTQMGSQCRLVGWDVDSTTISPSEPVIVALYWRALQQTEADYHVFVHIGTDDPVAQADGVPCCEEHPTYRWQMDEQVVDRHLLMVRESADPGVYPIWVGMYDSGTGSRLPVSDAQGNPLGDSLLLGWVRIGDPDYEQPSPTHPLNVTIGEGIRLLGYDLPADEARPGESIDLPLYWQCLARMDTSYTVFVHLVGPNGQTYEQQDSIPWQGRLPTTYWLAGEVIEDQYTVPLSPDAPKGTYSLVIGVYDLETGIRLAAADADGKPLADNSISIGQVTVHE